MCSLHHSRITLVLSVFCIACAIANSATCARGGTLFLDDFSDGSATDGNPVTWIAGPNLGSPVSFAVVNQDYRVSGGGGTSLVADSEAFADVSIRTVVRATVETFGNTAFHFLGPIARDNGAGSFYWGGITTNQYLSVGNWNPFNESAAVFVPLLDPALGDVDIQFDVVGQTLSLWAWSDAQGIAKPTTPQVVWNSALNRMHGSIGVSYNANGGQGWVDYRSVSVSDPTPEPGDTNADGAVNIEDLNNVRNNFGGSGLGDTNGDGTIDIVDLNNVRNFFGSAAPQSVPEPTSLALAALVLIPAVIVYRRFARTRPENFAMTAKCLPFFVVILLSAATARADIYRWDNGELIPGTEGIEPGPGVELDHRELEFAGLQGLDLTAARFDSSNLTSASLSSSNLTNVDASGANLTQANLFQSTLTYANFSRANLTNAVLLLASLEGTDLSGAQVRGANFSGTRGLTELQFYSTSSYQSGDLTGIGFYRSDLSGWDFAGKNLSNAVFYNPMMEGHGVADLSNAEFSQANLTDANLMYATLTGANMTGAKVNGTRFGGTLAKGFTAAQLYSTASYREHDLSGIRLGDCYGDCGEVPGWSFIGQNLTNASFAGLWVEGADFSASDVRGANFSGSGLTAAQLYSTTSYLARDLTGLSLSGNLSGWNFVGQDLTDTKFDYSTLRDANFTGATVRGAEFKDTTVEGFTPAQLYSTASYQARDLAGIRLGSALPFWNFAGQYLVNAYLGPWLEGADFTNADMRGGSVREDSLATALTSNLIRPDGHIDGLDLDGVATLEVRDYDGNPEFPKLGPTGIAVDGRFDIGDEGTLRMIFQSDSWDSTISFEPGIPVQLGGTLELTFANDVDVATQIGRTIRIFDWTGVEPSGAFAAASLYPWDVSELYTTGDVTMLLPGDTDGDGVVDIDDLNNVRNNFGGSGLGDTNNDGTIDIVDLNNVRNFYGSAAPQSVPEPSSLALLGIATLVSVVRAGRCARLRRRQFRRTLQPHRLERRPR